MASFGVDENRKLIEKQITQGGNTMQVFTEKQLTNYARALIWGLEQARRGSGGEFSKGDVIRIAFDSGATDLLEILYEELIIKGFHVNIDWGMTPKMEKTFFNFADNNQIELFPEWRKLFLNNMNGSIGIHAPTSLTHLRNCDQNRIALRQKSLKPFKDILFGREAKGLLGWTLGYYPTSALAKQAKMSLKEYAKEVAKACWLNEHNAREVWEDLAKRAEDYKNFLDKITSETEYFHIRSKNIDLKVGPGKKRRWLGVSGHNIPSFELFISPDWRTVEGTFYANEMSLKSGNVVQGVRLVFKKGSVVEASAKKGEKCLLKQIGEFSLTDKRFSPITKFMASTLFDENVGGEFGNCHIAVGSAYLDSYDGDQDRLTKKQKAELGFNDSAQHWDLINTEPKTVVAHKKNRSSRIIYNDSGEFDY